MMRNNRGTALSVGADVSGYAITGSTFFGNVQHLDISAGSDNYTITGCTFDHAPKANTVAPTRFAVIDANAGVTDTFAAPQFVQPGTSTKSI